MTVDIAGDDLPKRGMHRRLGNAIHVDQTRQSRMVVQPHPKTLRFKGFTAEHHNLELELPTPLTAQRSAGLQDSLQRIKRRRRPAQNADLLSNQQIVEVVRRARHRLRHHHQPPTTQQRTPDLPHRKVESQRMTLRPHPRARHISVQRRQQPGDIAMRDRHPLGHTGSTRGVNDVGDIVGARQRQRRAGLAANNGVTDITDIDDQQAMPIEPAGQISGRDRRDRRSIGNHEPDPLRRHAPDRSADTPPRS